MPDEVKKISVRIGGMNYQLVSVQDEKYMRQIAAKADEMIHRVMKNSPQLSHNMSTVLALVNALDELARTRLGHQDRDDMTQALESQVQSLQSELSKLREQNWDMKKDVLKLQAMCRDYETLLEETEGSVRLAEDPVAEQHGSAPERTAETELTQTNFDDYITDNGLSDSASDDSDD